MGIFLLIQQNRSRISSFISKIAARALLFLVIAMPQAQAVIELDLQFGYNRNIYGDSRQSKNTTRTYGGSVAFYFLGLTALELNYSQSEEKDINNDRLSLTGTGFSLTSQESSVRSYNYGVGIRQALGKRDSAVVPAMSIGYAKQFIYSYSTTSYQNDSTGDILLAQSNEQKYREDSVFGSFSLMLRLTSRMSLKGSVKTIFPAFDFNKMKDDLRYTIGLTWFF